ncbi:hypothetical protein BC829DRAFT_169519 [Chytridium lagenaria]|nr:hypothetical protein BC829DRAFT_169519 [Chytridium lagenaria]
MSDFHRLFLLWDGPNFHPVTKPTSTPIPLPPSSRSSRSESTGHSQTNNVAIPVAVNAFSRYRGVVSAFVLVIPDPTHLLPMYLHQHAWKGNQTPCFLLTPVGCVIRICSPIDTSPFVEVIIIPPVCTCNIRKDSTRHSYPHTSILIQTNI